MVEIKRIMRYLKGMEDYGLWYKKGGNFDLKAFTNGTKEKIKQLVAIYYDKTSAINISKNLVMHTKTKHIAIKYHFSRELV